MTRSLPLLLLFAASLGACGYNVHYEGTVVDGAGVARQGLTVKLADVGFAGSAYTDADTLARTTPVETAQTDAAGRFTLDHFTSDGFGCGAYDVPALLITDGVPLGAVAVVDAIDVDSKHQVDIGQIALPSELVVSADADNVHVALPNGAAANHGLVQVDGRSWFAKTDGELPAAALAACAKELPSCAHPISVRWSVGNVHLRTAVTSLDAAAPKPAVQAPITPSGIELNFTKPLELAAIYIDGVFSEDEALAADFPTHSTAPGLSLQTDLQAGFAELPSDACTIYGTGMKCTAPAMPVSAMSAPPRVSNTQIRLFAR